MRNIESGELKRIQLGLLEQLHKCCEEHNLRYYLIGGTLIGAIRHKGFIPWDDDIDVVMPRSDFDLLIKHFNGWIGEKSDATLISIENTSNYYLGCAKIIDKRTYLVEKVADSIPIGVYIDIFCMDNASDDYEKAVKLFKKTNKWRIIIREKNILGSNGIVWWKWAIHYILKLLFTPISRSFAVKEIKKTIKNEETTHITKYVCNYIQPTYGLKEIFFGEWFENRILAEFEGRQFYIPAGYDQLLRQVYGDYMQIPPKEKQCSHHLYDAFWKEGCEGGDEQG